MLGRRLVGDAIARRGEPLTAPAKTSFGYQRFRKKKDRKFGAGTACTSVKNGRRKIMGASLEFRA
jgi:hypothetical protein